MEIERLPIPDRTGPFPHLSLASFQDSFYILTNAAMICSLTIPWDGAIEKETLPETHNG